MRGREDEKYVVHCLEKQRTSDLQRSFVVLSICKNNPVDVTVGCRLTGRGFAYNLSLRRSVPFIWVKKVLGMEFVQMVKLNGKEFSDVSFRTEKWYL